MSRAKTYRKSIMSRMPNKNFINRLILAPMEGVLDATTRDLLTKINPYDLCITEFIRVTQSLLPDKTFYRLCPELLNAGETPCGTPVRVQLLGHDRHWLAENAVKALALGSHGIDINLGCPSKTVVGHQAGANLLKSPEAIFPLISAIRQAINKNAILSVKMRLGWESDQYCIEIADAITQAGANEITVHGRTKSGGYRADAINWQAIRKIKDFVPINVVANGDIFSRDLAIQCQKITQCQDLMIGRGALKQPNLGDQIKYNHALLPWNDIIQLFIDYAIEQNYLHPHHFASRTKQWLRYILEAYPQANSLFEQIRPLHDQAEIEKILYIHRTSKYPK